MKKNTILIICLSIFSIRLFAQTSATIPTYHWAYPYVAELQLKGYFTDLNVIQQPYTHAQLAHSLARIQQQISQGKLQPSSQDQWMIDLLAQEFNGRAQPGASEEKLIMQPGVWADQWMRYHDETTKFYTRLRSQAGVGLGEKLHFYNGIRLDQSLLDDPTYTGKKWKGIAAYAEQAYVRYSTPRFQLTLGRDFINWGSGRTGRLLFSDNARPLDQIQINFNYKAINVTALAVDLDQWKLSDSLVTQYRAEKANRFLTAHRLTVNFYNKLYIGFTEALVYGGPNSSWELKYHNPLLYYHGELLNHGGYDGNALLYLDVSFYPWTGWQFYGEILIDDFQIEKSDQVDLEPNQIGLIFGFRHADILGWRGSAIGLEYVRIANRTYNSWQEWEKFTHFNKTIGYQLENNFDRWNIALSYWLRKGLLLGLQCDYIRKGEGSVLDQWDEPWREFTVAQGYNEPFPYGVVESSWITKFQVRWHIKPNLFIDGSWQYQEIENFSYIINLSQVSRQARISLHWNLNRSFNY